MGVIQSAAAFQAGRRACPERSRRDLAYTKTRTTAAAAVDIGRAARWIAMEEK